MDDFETKFNELKAELDVFRAKQKETRERWSKNSKKYYNNKFKNNCSDPTTQEQMEKRRQYSKEYYAKNKANILSTARDKRQNQTITQTN